MNSATIKRLHRRNDRKIDCGMDPFEKFAYEKLPNIYDKLVRMF